MDDAGPLDATDAGELTPAVVEQGVNEGAVRISRCGVDDHAGGFVEDHEVVVLEQDFERDFLRLIVEGDGFGEDDGDFVAQLDPVARLGGVAVDLDELLADEGLDAGARQVGKAGGEKSIDALARTVFDYDFHAASLSVRKCAASFKFPSSDRVDSLRPCRSAPKLSPIVSPAGTR